MTRCAICGCKIEEESIIKEQFTGLELEVCEECDSKLEAVSETAQELDDSHYIAACESLMVDENKGRSKATNDLLNTYCKKCKNPDYVPEEEETSLNEDISNENKKEEEPNSFIEQIQKAMEQEEKEIREVEKNLEKSSTLATKILGLFFFIGGTVLSIILGFVCREVTVNYMTGNSVSSYNFQIAIFGSLAFFVCGLLIIAMGEYFYHLNLRTQMMEKLYYKIYDKLDE